MIRPDNGLKDSEVRMTRSHQDTDDGRKVCEIEFAVNSMIYEFDIDAASGFILEFDADLVD